MYKYNSNFITRLVKFRCYSISFPGEDYSNLFYEGPRVGLGVSMKLNCLYEYRIGRSVRLAYFEMEWGLEIFWLVCFFRRRLGTEYCHFLCLF